MPRTAPLILLALAWAPDARAGVVIHELLADPGTAVDANCDGVPDSTDDEFVEILNTGPGSVDLSYGTLEDATSVRHTFPVGTVLGELEAVVVFANGTPALDGSATGVADWCVDVSDRALVQVAGSLSLNNSGDTITLRDSGGAVLDQVTYGSEANDDQSITLDPEVIGTGFAKHGDVHGVLASPGSLGATLGVFEVIVDTGGGGGNGGGGTGGGCTGANAAQGLVINEFLVNAPGTDDGFEWVELFNGSNREVDLSGWAIASGTSSLSPGDPLPGGTTLGPGKHLVVGQSAAAAAVVDVVNGGWSLGNAGSNSDAVALEDCNGNRVDTVIYGDPNEGQFLDDDGNPSENTAPVPGEAASAARVPNGADTNDSFADFVELPFPTPGEPNDVDVESPCGGAATGLKINEFMPDPDGSDEGAEWVEIFHAGSESIDLTGWKIEKATSSWATFHAFVDGRIQPGERLLVGGELVDGVDVETTGTLGNASSNSDGVRILDCAGFPVDTVVYGSPNDDGFADDGGEIATRTAPSPGSGASLARVQDGFDTDDNQADFAETFEPTPGEPNPEVEPVVCVPSAGTVKLNEFMSDPEGSDEGYEWIEIYNSANDPVSVAGWGISTATSAFGAADITFPAGTEVPAKGWLVVGGEGVAEADVVLDLSIGNGTGGDGIRLYDCDGTSVDTVIYGDAGNEDGIPDDRGGIGEVYGDPGSAESMARKRDGIDEDIADDWTVTAVPTPGASNEAARTNTGEPTSQLGVGGCGFGANADQRRPRDIDRGQPEPMSPQAFCAQVPAPASLFLPLFLVGWLRRRP